MIVVGKKLNINYKKYLDRIKLWVKHEDKFVLLDKSESLKTINDKYWKY